VQLANRQGKHCLGKKLLSILPVSRLHFYSFIKRVGTKSWCMITSAFHGKGCLSDVVVCFSKAKVPMTGLTPSVAAAGAALASSMPLLRSVLKLFSVTGALNRADALGGSGWRRVGK
jgi:hypothetical protein